MHRPDERAATQNTQVLDAVAVVIWWIPRVCILCTSVFCILQTQLIDQNTLNIPDAAAVNVLHLQCNSWTVQDIAFISGILRRHAYWCTARVSKYLEMVDATVVVKCRISHPCRPCISWYSLQCSCTVLLPTSSVSTDGLFLTHQIFLPKVNVTLGVHCTQTWI